MLSDTISPGDRVEIFLNDEVFKGKYISSVEEILKDGTLLLYMPLNYGTIIYVPKDKIYSFVFITEKGILRYDSKVIEYLKKDGFEFMVVKPIVRTGLLQRRITKRQDYIREFKFSSCLEGETSAKGLIKDISLGGIRFITNEELQKGSKIKMYIPSAESEIMIFGDIIHKQYHPKSNYIYQYRVKFSDKDSISKFKIKQLLFNGKDTLK